MRNKTNIPFKRLNIHCDEFNTCTMVIIIVLIYCYLDNLVRYLYIIINEYIYNVYSIMLYVGSWEKQRYFILKNILSLYLT
jgi:hypothetical protein